MHDNQMIRFQIVYISCPKTSHAHTHTIHKSVTNRLHIGYTPFTKPFTHRLQTVYKSFTNRLQTVYKYRLQTVYTWITHFLQTVVLFVCPSVVLSVYVCPCLQVRPSIVLFVCPSVCSSVHLCVLCVYQFVSACIKFVSSLYQFVSSLYQFV